MQTRYIRVTISCQIKSWQNYMTTLPKISSVSDREHCRGRASCQAALLFYYAGFHFISGLRGTPFPDSEYQFTRNLHRDTKHARLKNQCRVINSLIGNASDDLTAVFSITDSRLRRSTRRVTGVHAVNYFVNYPVRDSFEKLPNFSVYALI